MRQTKTGLLVEGGGMKCAYSAGVLDVFLDEGITFDYCIGVSAGAANLLSYLAGQRGRNRRFYCEHVKDPRYLGMKNFVRTGSMFGLEYIYGELSTEGGEDPLDFEAVMANPSELVFPATDAATGKARYFTKAELKKNCYEPVMATSALPVMCRPVPYEDQVYYDGGVSDSLPVKKMLADGCDRIVALFSKPAGFLMRPQKYRRSYTLALHRKYPNMVQALNHRHEQYNRSITKIRELEEQGSAFTFAPSGEVAISTYTSDPAVMQQLYDNGVQDARQQAGAVKKFLAREN